MARCNGKSISGGAESIKVVLDGKGTLAKKAAEEEITRRRPKPKPLTTTASNPIPPTPVENGTSSVMPHRSQSNSTLSDSIPPQAPFPIHPPPSSHLPPFHASQHTRPPPETKASRLANLTAQLQAQSQGNFPRNTTSPQSQPFNHSAPGPPRTDTSHGPSTSYPASEHSFPHATGQSWTRPPSTTSQRLPPPSSTQYSSFSANPFDLAPRNFRPPPFAGQPRANPDKSTWSALSRRDEPDADHYFPVYSDDSFSDDDKDVDDESSMAQEEPLEVIETERRLRQNGRSYVFINKESLPIVGKRVPQLAEVRRHFEKFQVSEVRSSSPPCINVVSQD